MTIIKTAESVCEGHPDKLCDQISDAILDEALSLDNQSRVACEVMITKGHVFIAGEITCNTKIGIRQVIRRVLESCGYDARKFKIHMHIQKQSKDIRDGVDLALEVREGSQYDELGAGDQGTVYGYATNETYDRLPMPLSYAHQLCQRLDSARWLGTIEGIHSDGKSQVSVEYNDGKPKRIAAIIISIQHDEDKNIDQLKQEVKSRVILPVVRQDLLDEDTLILINPSGRFVIGGPDADTGLTGRKIMVDTYGGLGAHGGGAFSGKDPTKVDRSGAYMARHIARQVIDENLAEKCEIGISYAIGKAQPVAISVNTFGTGKLSDDKLKEIILLSYDLSPKGIIDYLNLRHVKYQRTACYGHFNSSRFTWEQTAHKKLTKEGIINGDEEVIS
ncbi:methionine adenosyltransferase [Fundicoccus sp. Sow4_H7]|uniref:Methionine adenosyltransferase n=1 Tax=Ruoffia halotolerans TaxID=2748684 RepID=A0A839A3X2_9LACT|nr:MULTISPECIES: methionine adenosyltransferase [Lactobacillales]MBA5728540.1 methionine adenosyltransferase [Ruoffia halotolerans]MDE1547753.1 methionine adenosyltransferase [Jeotgalibaca caeni]